MPLDPILKRLINKAYLNGFGNIHQFNSAQMRRFLTHPKLKVAKAHYQDFKRSAGDELTLRCYTPSETSTQICLPAILYISATAFVLDRLDASNDYCSLLANSLNMKIINVAHRLAPEHKFPRFLEDCLESIVWVYDNADRLAILKEKIGIWGESSGASIAATSTHVLRDKKLPIIKHQTLFYPMVDLVTPFPSKTQYGQGYMLDRPFIQWLDAQGFHPDQNRSCPLASPLLSSDFSNLPPATIITAEYDPLRDEGEAYAAKLQTSSVPVKMKRLNGMIHGFMRFYDNITAAKEALSFAALELKQSFSHWD